MTTYSSNNFKAGIKIIFEGLPYLIESNDFFKPGKGQAFNRVKMRCLTNNVLNEKIFKNTDILKEANINETDLIFLYKDEQLYYFMHPENFEQYTINKKLLKNIAKWLLSNVKYHAILWNNRLIQILPPKFVIMKIIETNPTCKGETLGRGSKIAKLTTGIKIKVPSFLKENETIKINTQTGAYISRVK